MRPDPDAKESVSKKAGESLSLARAVEIALIASGHEDRGLEFVCGAAQGGSNG